jgi:UPF0042 nucleotide-binding protein
MSVIRQFILITGMTGAGKGTAAKALEKLGFYVIDNLPPAMLDDLVAEITQAPDIDRLAVVVDSRSGSFFEHLDEALVELRFHGTEVRTIFLEAADEVLVRRQEAARRPHPLSREGRLMDGFAHERELLRTMRGRADVVIDTSRLNVHQLAKRVQSAFEDSDEVVLNATVMSFGFKYGIPIDADMVADMRFLPNPFWNEELRPLSGLDAPVSDFVLAQESALEFLETYENLVSLLTRGFLAEDKLFLTLAIGCTGGRHRSVAMTEALAARLREHGVRTQVVHRDLGRE